MLALHTILALALAGLSVSAPAASPALVQPADSSVTAKFTSAGFTKADIAAANSPAGLTVSLSKLPGNDSEVSALASSTNNSVWYFNVATFYCETSNASPLMNDVYSIANLFDTGGSFAYEFHGCTPLYWPIGTANMGYCGDLWPGHGMTNSLAKTLIQSIAYFCSTNLKAGGRANIGTGEFLVYHS